MSLHPTPADRFELMLHEATLARVRGIVSARSERLAAIRSRREAEDYVAHVRRCVRRSFGPLPGRTPLKASLTGVARAADYTIEKTVYESRPGFRVTASLYVPDAARHPGRRPAVLMLCGHSENGKAFDLYQAACIALARKGFLTLIPDPVEQGERHQFEHLPRAERPGLCDAHCMLGNQQALVGDFFGAWRLWDAIRGLDLLLERPEADRRRIGVTGNSGGGTVASYLAAIDPRPTMVAPSCFICSYAANIQNQLPSDAEQNPPGILRMGLDQADLLMAFAPKPTLILGQRDDLFDVRYTRKAAGELRRLHRLLGSRDSAAFFEGPADHGFFIENREAMVEFFMKHAGIRGDYREAPFTPLPAPVLQATPAGSVVQAGGRRIQDFGRETARRLRLGRGRPSADAVRRKARLLLGVAHPAQPPHYRVLRDSGAAPGAHSGFRQFGVETDPGILAIVSNLTDGGGVMHPAPGAALAYVGHGSGLREARDIPEVAGLAASRAPFFVIDPRGTRDPQPRATRSSTLLSAYSNDYLYAAAGEMLGESLLGRRVFDVLRGMDFLLACGAPRVSLAGRGIGSVTAAFAALLHPSRPDVLLMDYLPAYEDLVQADLCHWPLRSLLRGVLRHFDLPDVYRSLGQRLTLRSPWDPQLTEKA